MTEREFNQELVNDFNARFPNSYATLIPEHPRRQQQPFDIIIIHNGQTYCIECKRWKGKNKPVPTDEQYERLRKINNAGQHGFVLTYFEDKNCYFIHCANKTVNGNFYLKINGKWDFSWIENDMITVDTKLAIQINNLKNIEKNK